MGKIDSLRKFFQESHLFIDMNHILYICLTVCFAALPIAASADNTQTKQSATYIQYVDSAQRFMDNSRWGDAERCLNAALRMQPANPTNPLLFSNLGVCQTELGKYGNALQSFEVALVKTPDSPKILTNRARLYLLMNREEDAIQDLNHAIRGDSILEHALLLRGSLLMKQSKLQQAQKDFETLLRNGNENATVLASLGQCAMASGDKEGAQTFFDKALTKDPTPEIYFLIALEQIQNQQYNQAEESIYQGINKYQRVGELYLVRALLHKKRFQNNDAEIDKKIAIQYGVDTQTIESFFPGEPLPRLK